MATAEAVEKVVKKEEIQTKETAVQAGKFSMVGILNTIIDLGIFNVLIFIFKMNPITANIFAVGAAIINSFFWNKFWTFKDKETKHVVKEVALFISLSLIGMLLNTSVLKLLSEIWVAPGNLAVTIVHFIGLSSIFSDEFVFINFAKAWGLGVSMIWNFLAYKKIVFKK